MKINRVHNGFTTKHISLYIEFGFLVSIDGEVLKLKYITSEMYWLVQD